MAIAPPPQYDVNERARQLAALRYGTPLAQVGRERTLATVNNDAAINAINEWRSRGVTGINDAFNILDTNLATNVQNSEADLEDARQQISAIWDNTNRETEVMRDDALNYFNDLAARIGVPQMAAASSHLGNVSRIQQMAQQALNNSRYGASRKTSLEGQGRLHLQMLNRGQQYAKGDRANRLGSFEQEIARGLLGAQGRKLDQDYGLGGRLLDLLTEQGVYTGVEAGNQQDKQYAQLSGYNKQLLAEAELELKRNIAQAQLDDAAAARSAAASRGAADDRLAWEKFAREKQKFGIEGAAAKEAARMAQREDDEDDAFRQWNAEMGFRGATDEYGPGLQAAEMYAARNGISPETFAWFSSNAQQADRKDGQLDRDALLASLEQAGAQEYESQRDNWGGNWDMLGPASVEYLETKWNPYMSPDIAALADAWINGARLPRYGY